MLIYYIYVEKDGRYVTLLFITCLKLYSDRYSVYKSAKEQNT